MRDPARIDGRCNCNWCSDPTWRYWHCARCDATLPHKVSGWDLDVCATCDHEMGVESGRIATASTPPHRRGEGEE